MTNPLALAAEVAQLIEQCGGDYVLGGSLASSLLGEPRSTVDIDLAIHISAGDGLRLVEALESGPFYVPRDAALTALTAAGSFNAIHEESVYKIDFFVLGEAVLDRAQLERRTFVTIPTEPPLQLWVTSPEDQILRKLDWYRRGGGASDRQWRDVIGLLELGAELDHDYLSEVASVTGLTDLLTRALGQADVV